MKKLLVTALTVGFPSVAGTASAHHSFSATFKEDARIEVEGVVTKYSFKNPHVLIYFDVKNDEGTTTQWISEGGSATIMRSRRNWSKTTFKPGDIIRVNGSPTHDNSPMVAWRSIDLVDLETGKVIENVVSDLPRGQREGYDDQKIGPSSDNGQRRRPARQTAPVVYYKTPLTLPNGQPNVSGGWAFGGRPRPPQPNFNAVGQVRQDSYIVAHDAQVFCDAPGLVRQAGTTPHPFVIAQFDDRIVIEYEEYGGRREIFFGDKTPPPGPRTHLGDSVARVKGDTIEIETVNLLENLGSPEGNYISDQATTIETLRRVDNDIQGAVIEYKVVTTDPIYLKEPTVQVRTKGLVENYEMIENDCQPPLRERVFVSPYTSFFLTSSGLDNGADIEGIEDADAHCEALASELGHGGKGWRAYVSTNGRDGVNAKDRIGNGPWYNAGGDLIAANLDQLSSAVSIPQSFIRTERGAKIPDGFNAPSLANGTGLKSGADLFYCFATQENGVFREVEMPPAPTGWVNPRPRGGPGGPPSSIVDGPSQSEIAGTPQGGTSNWFLIVIGLALALFAGMLVMKKRSTQD